MGSKVLTDATGREIKEGLDNIALMLAGITEKEDGSGLVFRSPRTLQNLNRMGLASKVLSDYSTIYVNMETSLTAAVHSEGGGITAASVVEDTFIEAVESSDSKEYEFVSDGSAWHLDGHTVNLATYGITVTGTPADGDTVVIHVNSSQRQYDVLGIDHDVPADPNFEHTITLGAHNVKMYGSLAYKKPQGLIYVDPAIYPDGIAQGTLCYVTSLNGAYDGSTTEDGIFGFEAPVNIPADALIRHTTIGAYRATYAKSNVTGGKFTIYGTRANGRALLAENIATQEVDGSSGTNLGTFTSEDISKRSAANLNLSRRNAYGSNYYLGSDERAWMNSKKPSGQEANGLQKWQAEVGLGIFDLPSSCTSAGNLHGMDPEMVAVMGAVKKRTYLHSADRSDPSVKYVDTNELVFPLSMLEANLGTANDGVYENAVNRDGTVKTTPYPYFARRTTNAERIKYQGGTARDWFLRSPYPSDCYNVRICTGAGALNYHGARNTHGAVDAFNIV